MKLRVFILVTAVALAYGRIEQQAEEEEYKHPLVTNPPKVHFVDLGDGLSGSYKFGFDTGKTEVGQVFRQEKRLDNGTVIGRYGYVDANGEQRIVSYRAGKEGFVVTGDIEADRNGPTAPTQNPRTRGQRPAQRPAPRPAPRPVQRPAPRPAPRPVHRPAPPVYRPPQQQQPSYRPPPQQPIYRPPPRQQPIYRPPPQQPIYRPPQQHHQPRYFAPQQQAFRQPQQHIPRPPPQQFIPRPPPQQRAPRPAPQRPYVPPRQAPTEAPKPTEPTEMPDYGPPVIPTELLSYGFGSAYTGEELDF